MMKCQLQTLFYVPITFDHIPSCPNYRQYSILPSSVPNSFVERHIPSDAEKKEISVLDGAETPSGIVAELVQFLTERKRLPGKIEKLSMWAGRITIGT